MTDGRYDTLGGWAGATWAAACVVFLAGCSGDTGGYDPAVRYPLRADRVVLETPPAAPASPAPPGQLDETIAGYDAVGGRTLDPAGLPADAAAAVTAALDEAFGSPAEPRVPGPPDAVPGVSLAPAELARGAALYADKCVHCHGVSGNGRGFGAGFLYPHPRDYRAGVFKSADGAAKPTAGRLKRVLRESVPGTAMPYFDVLPDGDIDALVGYVVHLSLRGEVEQELLCGLLDDEGVLTPAAVPSAAADGSRRVLAAWAGARETPAVAGLADGVPGPAAVRRGQAVFAGVGGCVACHGAAGGGGVHQYDAWGGVARTADLTQKPSDYKWGRRPADIAGHVRGGIAGARMPAGATLTDAQVADVTAFVRGLSLGALPADVRGRLAERPAQ